MHKLRNSIVWAVILLLALLPIGRTNGCGVYYFKDEYRMVFFNPGLVEDSILSPFKLFFDPPFAYPIQNPEKKDYQRNCQEWVNYLGAEVTVSDVHKVLYQSNSDQVLSAIQEKRLNDFLPGNTFVKKLLEPAQKDALNYLELAIHAEFTHFADTDPWGLDENLFDFKQKINALIKLAKARLKVVKDSFLVQRYAFQLVVQCRYAGLNQECLQYCNQYFPLDHPGSILMPWAQFHKAAVLTAENKLPESNYVLSRVFDLCESKKHRVHLLVDPKALEQALALTKNQREKAAILTLLCYKNAGRSLKYLEQIARLDPGSRYLPQLILREINKIEDWLLTTKFTFFAQRDDFSWNGVEGVDYMPVEDRGLWMNEIPYLKKNLKKDQIYLRQTRDWLESLVQKYRFTTREFGNLAIAHLYYLDHQPVQARLFLQKIPDQKNTVLQLQKNLIQLLILPDLMDIRSAHAKAEIVKNFAVIRNQSNLLDSTLRIYPKLMLYFSRLYHQKGDVVAAGLLHRRAMIVPTNGGRDWSSDYYAAISYFDRFASLKDMDDLIALAQKKVRSSFEKFLTDTLCILEKIEPEPWDDAPHGPINTLPTIEQLYDLKGTIAFRQNRLKEAFEAFEQLPDTYWRDTYEFGNFLTHDPFVDAQSFPWEGKRLELGSKKAMLKKMLELEKLSSKTGPQQAEAAYLLANAYFNSSYWGRWWMMDSYGKSAVSYGWGFQDHKSRNPETERVPRVYYKLSRAVAYYQKALQNTPNVELAARATYMLGYCEKYSKIAGGEFYEEYFDKGKVTYISPIFSTFRKKFGQTLAYQECLKNCPELADYFKTR